MPTVPNRPLSPGELKELERLAAIEAVRAGKRRPGDHPHRGMPVIKPSRFHAVERSADNSW